MLENRQENSMTPIDWYELAKQKVDTFLIELDPALQVEVEQIGVQPYDQTDEYESYVLLFSHPNNDLLHWSMEITHSLDFIDNELENTVRGIFKQRAA
jgi:hypothetical protein